MKKLFFVVGLFLGYIFTNAQNVEKAGLDSISQLSKVLYDEGDDSVKIVANVAAERLFEEILTSRNLSFLHFDSLRFVKEICTEDAGVRIFTWAVPLSDGAFLYSGFIQKIDRKGSTAKVFRLKTKSADIDQFTSYTAENWPGAVYNQIIETRVGKQTLYTLFGWIGGSKGATHRIIETIFFTEDRNPVFGQPVFSGFSSRLQSRVIFKFNSQVPFHLGYEKQLIPGKKKKQFMIVFNRLIESKPEMGLIPGLKVADYSLFDGFIFRDDRWVFIENVDARMPENKEKASKPPADLDLVPASKRK